MRLRDRPAARLLQRRRRQRLDAEAHRPEPGGVQLVEQLGVEPIEPRFGLERQRQAARLDLVAQLEQRSRCSVKSGSRKMTYGRRYWSHSRSISSTMFAIERAR